MPVFELMSLLWATGAVGLLLFQLGKLLRLRRMLRSAEEEAPGVFCSGAIRSAFVLGFVRPRIYLPAGLSEQARQYILLHERTHIRRLDHIWKPLALLCLCVHWFDPLVWVCCGLFYRDVELACDEAATDSLSQDARCDYAQTLLSLSGPNPAAPLPAFSQPEPERRIRRILDWKRPKTILCVILLVLVLALGLGLLVNPASKNDIFGRQYKISALLYENPSFNSTYREDLFSSFALSEDHTLYTQQSNGIFNACNGKQEEIKLSGDDLLPLFEADWLDDGVRSKLMRVSSGWLVRGPNGQVPFYLFMPSGNSLLFAFGYGLGSDFPFVRWLFELTPDQNRFTLKELAALIRRSDNLTDRESIQLYSIYESESIPGLLFAAYDGDQNGAAVFSYDAAMPGYRIRAETTSIKQDTFYSETSTWYDLGKSFSIITSHHENAAEVRAVWDGIELTAPIWSCPAMVILEWPDAFPLNPDSSPEIHFYNAAGSEIPRE